MCGPPLKHVRPLADSVTTARPVMPSDFEHTARYFFRNRSGSLVKFTQPCQNGLAASDSAPLRIRPMSRKLDSSRCVSS
jgi:hypothetical protein